MESLKHFQFTKKALGTKWMKKLIQLCSLHFLVHESKVEGACSVVKKMCLQFKCNPLFFEHAAVALSVTIPKRI